MPKLHILTVGNKSYKVSDTVSELMELIRTNAHHALNNTVNYNIVDTDSDEVSYFLTLQIEISNLKQELNNENNLAIVNTAIANQLHKMEQQFHEGLFKAIQLHLNGGN